MNETKPEILAKVRFMTTEEGGRETPTPKDRFGCFFEYGGEYFDCFLLLDKIGSLTPGIEIVIPIKFLYPDFIKNKLKIGHSFKLKELRVIAEGEILKILK